LIQNVSGKITHISDKPIRKVKKQNI